MPSPAAQSVDTVLSLTRLLNATPERVWKAWTDPAEVGKWMGPGPWTGSFSATGLAAGADYRIEMRHPDGDVMVVVGRLREVEPARRMVYSWAWLGEDGKPGHETLVTLTLRAVGNKTELTLKHEGFEDREGRDNHNEGWAGALDKLEELLAGKR
jgi:uncharacterized protein YndB with AHSA1/START domain